MSELTNILSATSKLQLESSYKELSGTLDDLVKIYRSLLDVVRREKEILTDSRLDELNENNKSKDALLVRIRTLENSRMKSAREMAQILGGDVDQPRLLELAAKMPGERGDRLRNLHSVLELLVRRVAEVNKQNEELVQSALRHITGAMEAVKEGLAPKSTYEKHGSVAGRVEGGALVNREA
ncbi:MAG TPA: flagellar protein FlgN [Pseudobdellovibrionaceae bacterium]|nr:flagellar protein FlgN [Pseudobdellovibrionaceae bacterium]